VKTIVDVEGTNTEEPWPGTGTRHDLPFPSEAARCLEHQTPQDQRPWMPENSIEPGRY
jgi:hypothetical protein